MAAANIVTMVIMKSVEHKKNLLQIMHIYPKQIFSSIKINFVLTLTKIRVRVELSGWQDSLAKQITSLLLPCCACSGTHMLKQSCWKFTVINNM